MAQSTEWNRLTKEQRDIIEEHQAENSVPVGALAGRFDLQVKIANLGPGISGCILKRDGSYTIKVNRFEAKGRQRFTIAHEIAHFLLHRHIIDQSPNGITDTVLYRSGAPEQTEFEANRLASDILMPEKSVKKRLEELGGNVSDTVIEALAENFGVSKGAMEIRLQNIAV